MNKAIIIGASSGMGAAITNILLEKGWKVGIAARRVQPLLDIKAKWGDACIVSQIDVCQEDAPEKLLQLIEDTGGADLYFHVAGVGKQNTLLDPNIEKHTVATNGLGFTNMIDAAFNYMAQHNGGHIAVISSIAGTKGLGAAPSYSATKAFQNTYIQALEQLSQMRKLNITFTDIRPGFVDTPLIEGSNFPMKMNVNKVATDIVDAVLAKKHVKIIDWRYRILVFFWRLIPNCVWRRLPIGNKKI